jgi:hypothetical protein
MELTLSTEEQQLLLDILEQRHRELLKEISHTAHRDFKQGLRKNEQLLEFNDEPFAGKTAGASCLELVCSPK